MGPNFLQDREIQVIAEAMDDTGEVFIQPVGLRIQGNSARGWDKKRLILVSREEYSGQKNFNGQFFPGIASHSVMLKKELPDSLVSELVADRAVATQSTVPVRVFFNGEFWYDSFLLERYDQQYFRQHYQVNDCTRVKDLEVEDHSDSQTEADYFSEYMFWVSNTDFSDEKQWLQLQKETDVQSYIDFICINYFLCNWDFSDDKNCIMWRSPRFEEVPCGDMRWRWCIYDVDALVWTQNHYEVDNPAELNIFSANLPYTDVKVKDTAHFRSLRSNPEFNRRFVLSFMDLLNNNFSLPNVQRVLEKYGESLDWMGGYFRKRPQYAVQHLAEEFGLTGTLEPVTIITQNPEMGSVVVNTSTVDLSSGYWCGEYFTDYPITITAAAKEGYRFVEWRGCTDTTSETITLAVDGGVSMEAVFEKKSR